MFNGVRSVIKEVGVFSPKMKPQDELGPGSVGYIVINIREVADVKVGDTITLANDPAEEPLPGFKEVQPDGLQRHLPARARPITRSSRLRSASWRSTTPP
jgi:translation elongation factor EF-4